jgi:amino acid permease
MNTRIIPGIFLGLVLLGLLGVLGWGVPNEIKAVKRRHTFRVMVIGLFLFCVVGGVGMALVFLIHPDTLEKMKHDLREQARGWDSVIKVEVIMYLIITIMIAVFIRVFFLGGGMERKKPVLVLRYIAEFIILLALGAVVFLWIPCYWYDTIGFKGSCKSVGPDHPPPLGEKFFIWWGPKITENWQTYLRFFFISIFVLLVFYLRLKWWERGTYLAKLRAENARWYHQ